MAIAAALAFLVSGCSELGFPSVHDVPAPRADTPLTPDQVKQATDDLISARDHLSSEAQSNAVANTAPNAAGNAASAVQKKPLPIPLATAPAAPSGATQTAGADTKP